MKRFFAIFTASLFCLSIFATNSFGYAGKGQRIFLKKLRVACGYNGFVMAKKHTQQEWLKIYESGKLNETMTSYCGDDARAFKTSEEVHVKDFLYAFASDSGSVVAG